MSVEETQEVASSGRAEFQTAENGLAVVMLGSPVERVVTLTMDRMRSLQELLTQFQKNPPSGVIFLSARPDMFTVGADIGLINEITSAGEGEKLATEGQAIFQMIADLPCPTIAAISGPCMGGGCELSLACDYRIITEEKPSQIGLPEIKIGILPGFGGTQRLPRLVGLPRALDIILAGKTLRPKQALKAGLVDEIVPFDKLRETAVAIASGKKKVNRKGPSFFDNLLTKVGFGRNIVHKKAKATLMKKTKGLYPAPLSALETTISGLSLGLPKGLELEARELGRLVVTPECKSLVHVFYLTEQSKSIGKAASGSLKNVHGVVIGAGTMGAGIAGVLAKNDCQVILKDREQAGVDRGMNHIRDYVQSLRYLNEQQKSFVLNRIEGTTVDSPNLGNANIVIEAIFEDMNLKTKVLGDMAKRVPQDTIIASNTSSLSISEIANSIPNAGRVCGMHFFNPVEKMPLVEIVRGDQTTDKTVAIVAALAVRLGKFPIVVRDVPGFLVNRTLFPYLNEAAYLLQDGYSIEAIDRAAERFGMPMGPLRLMDEVGLDVGAHVSDVMANGYPDRMTAPPFLQPLVKAGRLGKKTKLGFYDYSADKRGKVDPESLKLLGVKGDRDGTGDQEHITKRLIFSLVNEGIRCLDEGVAGAPGPEAARQVDLGTVMGIGFPPFLGGLVRYVDKLGAHEVARELESLKKATNGDRFIPWKGIQERANGGRSFYDAL